MLARETIANFEYFLREKILQKYAHWHIIKESSNTGKKSILTGYYDCYSVKLILWIRFDEKIFL